MKEWNFHVLNYGLVMQYQLGKEKEKVVLTYK
jgi:hypothetical protein